MAIAILSISFSCRSTEVPEPQPLQEMYKAPPPGYSGMAKHGPSSYLVVHDTKGHREGPRLGLLEVTADAGGRYSPIDVADWKDPGGRSSDLESACSLAQRSGEFLVAESGYWKGKYGRLFHLRLSGGETEVLGAYKLPFLADNDEEHRGDNFEGMACIKKDEERFLVLLGERGGSSLYPTGVVRWGMLDLRQLSLKWQDDGRAGVKVTSPGNWPADAPKRDISDLYVGVDGVLWAVATADAGDNGPFRSLIYKAGRVSTDKARPFEPFQSVSAAWTMDGIKVESLADPTEVVEGGVLSIGSEDENLGGVWRALYPIVEEQ